MQTHDPVSVSFIGLVMEAASRGHGTYVPEDMDIPDEYAPDRV
jgi:hypothetical protein